MSLGFEETTFTESSAESSAAEVEERPQTLAELFLIAAGRFDCDDALSYKRGGEWRKISSGEMITRIERIALGLYSLGLRKGDRAAILASNSPEWTLADAGCQFSSVIDIPIYTTLSVPSVGYILSEARPKIFFLEDRASYERVRQPVSDCDAIEMLIFFDPNFQNIENAISLDDLEVLGQRLGADQPGLLKTLIDAVGPNDIATLIYTSGTTGEPKGVMLTHANIISNAIDAGEKFAFSDRDVCLSVLPLSHIFERTGMYLYILSGIAVHYAESIDKVPENLLEVRPTIFIGVPRIFEKVYARARLKAAQSSRFRERIFDWAVEIAKEYAMALENGETISSAMAIEHAMADRMVYKRMREFFGGNLRFCITGGAALPDDIYLIFTGAGIPIMQGYGLTETSPVISSNNPEHKKLGTVGRPIRNVSVRLAADGEIEAKGPGVMVGYYNKPDGTHEAFDGEWFKTGDIGDIDADGFLKVTDRKKELFKTSGGKYIAPSPIEQLIRASRFVSQVVLIGNERKFPAALIVPNFEMLESYARLKGLDLHTAKDYCENARILDLLERQVAEHTEHLSQYEKVKKIALLPDEMTVEGGELTPTLKVRRKIVDEKYRGVIDRLYSQN
ncbi:MAG: long-chain fatty acid--CoA ligase [Acidobacteriota bacterium]